MASTEKALLAQDAEIQSLKSRAKNALQKNKKQINDAMESATTVIAAGGFGYLDGRYADKMDKGIAGVSIPAVVGGAIVLGAIAGVIPDEPYVMGVGSGALAAWAYKAGLKKGQDAAAGV